MATLPVPEANGRPVPDICAHFHSRPGDVPGSTDFPAVATRRYVEVSNRQRSLNCAVGMGRREDTPEGSVRLSRFPPKWLPVRR